jgi:dipeptidyl aminopeptidase/acylaminoacyl peptidase
MRLVQQAMLPEAQQVHLAEVFLSGLLRQLPGSGPASHPDEGLYDFVEGVRDLLFQALPVSEVILVLQQVSALVSSQTGQPFDFAALLADPTSDEPLSVPEGSRPFARMAAGQLRRLGPQFARLTTRLEQGARAAQAGDVPPGPASPPAVTPLRTYSPGGDVLFRMAWSPDGQVLTVPSRDGTVRFFEGWAPHDPATDPPARTLNVSPRFGVNQVAWSPDGQLFATASYDRVVRVWSYPDLKHVARLSGHGSDVCTVAWSPFGGTVVSGSNGGTARFWDTHTWQIRQHARGR